jgi:mannose-1-phosphate guanylyltransferase
MNGMRSNWAVVLAAGEGTRLAALTRDAAGNAVPKQFCSLNGGQALVQEAIARARSLAPLDRTCAIVAEQHSWHWRRALRCLAPENIIVQPQNRGTAHGVLLCVLSILARDPLARIVFLPADHFVLDESALARCLLQLSTSLPHNPDGLTLVGIEPGDADPELGYIVPGRTLSDGSRNVSRFVEKPAAPLARQLFATKALWNSFIFGASGTALLGLLRRQLGDTVEEMTIALSRDEQAGTCSHLSELYDRLPTVDFSRAIVQQFPCTLRVITASACGWNDLGTPRRVAVTLGLLTKRGPTVTPDRVALARRVPPPAFVNIAAQQRRLALPGQ